MLGRLGRLRNDPSEQLDGIDAGPVISRSPSSSGWAGGLLWSDLVGQLADARIASGRGICVWGVRRWHHARTREGTLWLLGL